MINEDYADSKDDPTLYKDDLKLHFGKFKGMTPNELYDAGESSYLCWMYVTVERFPTCSLTLYRLALKDKDSREADRRGNRPAFPTSMSRLAQQAQDFDDDDDDIPF